MGQGISTRAFRLNRAAPVPLYHQLAEYLRQQIEQGPWQPGDFFTTEEELQKTFQVSRATVRRALQQLMDEGLLERITGKGTFIARPPLRISLPHLVSFSEEITSRGMLPSTQVLNKGVVPVPDAVAEMLRMAPGSPVLRVNRLRYADHEPWVYMVDYIHPRLGLHPDDAFEGSLYELMTRRANVRVETAVHEIRAIIIPDDVARRLDVPPGSPGLLFHRTSFDESGDPLVYQEAIRRGDHYTYTMQLTRKGGLRRSFG